MSYDGAAAERVRAALAGVADLREIRMMGGLCFMTRGHMCCGIGEGGLMLRVGADGRDAALAEPHTRPMTMRGTELAAFVVVEPAGFVTDAALRRRLRRALDFVATLPPKPAAKSARAPSATPRARRAP